MDEAGQSDLVGLPCSVLAPGSGLEPHPLPGAGVGQVPLAGAAEDDAVVQAVATARPELDLVADDAPAAPEVRHRHVVRSPGLGETLEHLLPPALELGAVGGGARLVGGPGRQARAVGP